MICGMEDLQETQLKFIIVISVNASHNKNNMRIYKEEKGINLLNNEYIFNHQ